jgi:glycosyltransferase involved in cell wall biosynthesis
VRVAIVIDGIWVYGGAERVLESMLEIYPDADIYALVDLLPDDARKWLGGRRITTSFLQALPGTRHYFRKLLSLWPIAIEQFDLSGYDLIISSQFAVAHGAITGPSQVHVTYTHSPMRYAWDLQAQYLREARLDRGPQTLVARPMLHRLRMWDAAAANRVDSFSANSSFVAERIRKYYRRDSTVIYPPVFLDRFTVRAAKDDYYLYLGRLVAYKRVDLIVDAFAEMPDRKLVIAGDGPLLKSLRARATPNVTVLGGVDAAHADALMGGARAYVYAAIEDFGIAPVEAQAAGTPVIGLGIGGLRETVRDFSADRPTGLFFSEQTVDAIRDAVEKFELVGRDISPSDCRENALRFAPGHFQEDFRRFVELAMRKHGIAPHSTGGEDAATEFIPAAA